MPVIEDEAGDSRQATWRRRLPDKPVFVSKVGG
jgi:hypothetical protein